MEVGNPQSLVSTFGTLVFNELDNGAGLGLDPGNGYLAQAIEGGVYPQIRNPVGNRPRADGGIVHKFFKGSKDIRIEGIIVATAPVFRTLLDDHLRGVTNPGLAEDMTYTWGNPPYPYSDVRTHQVRLFEPVDIPAQSSGGGASAAPKTFSFTLIAFGVAGEDGFDGVV